MKPFEVRKNDRGFEVGDILDLREFDPEKEEYTGCRCEYLVTYILKGPMFGIKTGFCVMGIKLRN